MSGDNSKGLGILITVAVALIIGVVLIQIISGQINDSTSMTTTTEAIDISPALVSTTTNVVNDTHDSTFSTSSLGIFYLPTITNATLNYSTRNISCTNIVITNATGGTKILGEPTGDYNWSWATTTFVRGRCGIIIDDAAYFPDVAFNNSLWNFSYTVKYQDINTTYNFTVTQAPTGWKSTDCPLSTTGSLTNGSTTLTRNTDFKGTTDGKYSLMGSLINNLTQTNTYSATYSYCADDYLNSSWGRSVFSMVPGFFALALIGVGLYLAYYLLRKEDIL